MLLPASRVARRRLPRRQVATSWSRPPPPSSTAAGFWPRRETIPRAAEEEEEEGAGGSSPLSPLMGPGWTALRGG